MTEKNRTNQQSKSLHLWFEFLAQELNDAGYDVRKTLKHDFEIPWTSSLIKEILWRSVQKEMFKKQSTADLSSGELQLTWNVLNRHIGEKFGIHVPFPSLEDLVEQDKRLKADYPVHDEEPEF